MENDHFLFFSKGFGELTKNMFQYITRIWYGVCRISTANYNLFNLITYKFNRDEKIFTSNDFISIVLCRNSKCFSTGI